MFNWPKGTSLPWVKLVDGKTVGVKGVPVFCIVYKWFILSLTHTAVYIIEWAESWMLVEIARIDLLRVIMFIWDPCYGFSVLYDVFKCNIFLCAGSLSEEGLLVYLRVLQTFLSQLPVSASGADCQDSPSDSEDDEQINKVASVSVSIRTVLKKFYKSNTQAWSGFLYCRM